MWVWGVIPSKDRQPAPSSRGGYGEGRGKEVAVIVMREVIGEELRRRRQDQGRTLREVSGAAAVSLGYLSEVERGHKEASSELLAAICEALTSACRNCWLR